jgi:hypothetical protein
MDSLTQDELKKHLHYDTETGIFTRLISTNHNAIVGSVAGSVKYNGYIHISVMGKLYYAHRLAWLYMTGDWPKNDIDHINRERNDNKWINLRNATPSQNHMNKATPKSNTSGYRGVSFNKLVKKWTAQIKINRKKIHLGCFACKEEAAKSYEKAAKVIYGEFYYGS